jgi:hypothetical protein
VQHSIPSSFFKLSMARLFFTCLLLISILSLVIAQRHTFVAGSHSQSLRTAPMAPRHDISMEHSCVCGAGFTQEQHFTRHKHSWSVSKEIAERAFEKGLKHRRRSTAKRKRTESGASNASSSRRQSLCPVSSRSRMSVDVEGQDDIRMENEPEVCRSSII